MIAKSNFGYEGDSLSEKRPRGEGVCLDLYHATPLHIHELDYHVSIPHLSPPRYKNIPSWRMVDFNSGSCAKGREAITRLVRKVRGGL